MKNTLLIILQILYITIINGHNWYPNVDMVIFDDTKYELDQVLICEPISHTTALMGGSTSGQDGGSDDNDAGDTTYGAAPQSVNCLSFGVRYSEFTDNLDQVRISLNLLPNQYNDTVNIVFTKDQLKIIRHFDESEDVEVNVDTDIYLETEVFNNYWITWYDGIYKVGQEGNPEPVITWTETQTFDIAYFGIHSFRNKGYTILRGPICPLHAGNLILETLCKTKG